MTPNEYQKLASRTLIDKPDFEITPEHVMISWNIIGLAGEVGELSELIKHGIYHQEGLDLEHIKKELGDCQWYLSSLCKEFGFALEEIMETNIEKLKKRYPNGYNFKDGIIRADGEKRD